VSEVVIELGLNFYIVILLKFNPPSLHKWGYGRVRPVQKLCTGEKKDEHLAI